MHIVFVCVCVFFFFGKWKVGWCGGFLLGVELEFLGELWF